MARSTFLPGFAFACSAIALLTTQPSFANKQASLPPIQVVGVDAVCDSFTTSTDPSSGSTILTCVAPSNSPGVPTGCNATVNSSQSVTLSSSGGSVNLAVNGCSTTSSSAITYNWSRNGLSNASTSQSWTDVLPQNTSTTASNTYSYQVQACAGSACATFPGSPLQAIVPSAASTTPPPSGSGFTGSCSGFSNTRVLVENWANPVRLKTADYGGFGPNDIIVVQITTGSATSGSNLLRISGAEWQDAPYNRIAALSDMACDFTGNSLAQYWGTTSTNSTSVTVPFTVNNPNNFGFYPILNTNKTYYLNIKMAPNSGCTSTCNMFIDLSKFGNQ